MILPRIVKSGVIRKSYFAQHLQIAFPGRHTAHIADHRFDDHSRNLILIAREGALHGVGRIERQSQRELRLLLENACRSGNAQGRNSGSSFHQERIGVSVIAALELHYIFALSKRTRQANCRHRRFGARADKAHHFNGGERGDYKSSQVGFSGSRCAEAGTILGSPLYGFGHLGIGVAENHRTPRPDIVDVSIAALSANDDRWFSSDSAKCAHRRIDAARKNFLRALLEGARLCRSIHEHSVYMGCRGVKESPRQGFGWVR